MHVCLDEASFHVQVFKCIVSDYLVLLRFIMWNNQEIFNLLRHLVCKWSSQCFPVELGPRVELAKHF